MTAKLYCFGESGNAYKAALTMALAGYPFEPVFVGFFGGETRRPEFLALNPMGEVPVFVEGGIKLSQSGVIQMHVAETMEMFQGRPEHHNAVMRWMFWDNHKGSSQFGALRYMRHFVPEASRKPEVIAWMEGRVQSALKVLDTHMAGGDWVAADQPTIADFACCSYLYYPEEFGYSAAKFPHIARWLDRIKALDGWVHPYDLMPGNPSDRA